MDHTSLINSIQEYLSISGHYVQISTYTKSKLYSHKHKDYFKVGRDLSPLVKRGKHWDDFSGCKISFYKEVE